MLLAAAGCGGSQAIGSSPGPDGGGGGGAAAAPDYGGAAALVIVDRETNKAHVRDLNGSSDGRAAFVSPAIKVESVTVVDDPASVSVKSIRMRITNQSGYTIQNPTLVITDLGMATSNEIAASLVSTVPFAFSGNPGAQDGTTATAMINRPGCSFVDTDGTVYVTSQADGRVYKISKGSVVMIRAGLLGPTGIVGIPNTSSLAVSETTGHRVTIISKTGLFVGSYGQQGAAGLVDGDRTTARFNEPRGLTADDTGILYVADTGNSRIRRITTPNGNGLVGTTSGPMTGLSDVAFGVVGGERVLFAVMPTQHDVNFFQLGTGIAGNLTPRAGLGFEDGSAQTALLNRPTGVAVYGGRVFVADAGNRRVRVLTPPAGLFSRDPRTWSVSTVAGNGTDGIQTGAGLLSSFRDPFDVEVGRNGLMLVTDLVAHWIREVKAETGFSWEFGSSSADSPAEAFASISNADSILALETPTGPTARQYLVAIPQAGAGQTVDARPLTFSLLSSSGGRFMRYLLRVTGDSNPNGHLDVVFGQTGSSRVLFSHRYGTGIPGYQDGDGLSTRFLDEPGLACDGSGRLFLATGARIRMIDHDGRAYTIAGIETSKATQEGNGSTALIGSLTGHIECNREGTMLWFGAGHCIWQMQLDGSDRRSPSNWQLRVAYGKYDAPSYRDTNGPEARFDGPTGIVYSDTTGELFVADSHNYVIRVFQTRIQDFRTRRAGQPGNPGYQNGLPDSAKFALIRDIALTRDGYLLVAEEFGRVRLVTSSGATSLFAGSEDGTYGYSNGTGNNALFGRLTSIEVDSNNIAYLADLEFGLRAILPNRQVGSVAGVRGNSGTYGLGNSIRPRLGSIALMPNGDLAASTEGAIGFFRRVVQ